MSVYFVDHENVHNAGLEGVQNLTKEDEVIILYGKNAPAIPIDLHVEMQRSEAKMTYIKVEKVGKNFLDFQLSSITGYMVATTGQENFIIVSGDSGYDAVVELWNNHPLDERKVTFVRRNTITAMPTNMKKAGKKVKNTINSTINTTISNTTNKRRGRAGAVNKNKVMTENSVIETTGQKNSTLVESVMQLTDIIAKEGQKNEGVIKTDEILNEEKIKIDEGLKSDNTLKSEENIKPEDASKLEENIKSGDTSKSEENIKPEDTSKLEENIKSGDTSELEENIELGDTSKLEENMKSDDTLKSEENEYIEKEETLLIQEKTEVKGNNKEQQEKGKKTYRNRTGKNNYRNRTKYAKNASGLVEAERKPIRNAVKDLKLAPNEYTKIYKCFEQATTKQAYNNMLHSVLKEETGYKVYSVTKELFAEKEK